MTTLLQQQEESELWEHKVCLNNSHKASDKNSYLVPPENIIAIIPYQVNRKRQTLGIGEVGMSAEEGMEVTSQEENSRFYTQEIKSENKFTYSISILIN